MVSVLRLFVVFMGFLVFSPDLFAQFCLNLKRRYTDGTTLYYTNKNPVRHILEGGSNYPAGTFCVSFLGNSREVTIDVLFKENKRGGACKNSRLWGLKQETPSCNKILTAFGGPNAPKFLKDYEVDTGKYYPPPPPEEPKQASSANAVTDCSCSCESKGSCSSTGCACSCGGQQARTFMSCSD